MQIHNLNNVLVINATPHSIKFQVSSEVIEIPADMELAKLLSARPIEQVADVVSYNGLAALVTTQFQVTEEAQKFLGEFKCNPDHKDVLIVSSIISAQACGYPVVSLITVAGLEREAPLNRLYRYDKFNVF